MIQNVILFYPDPDRKWTLVSFNFLEAALKLPELCYRGEVLNWRQVDLSLICAFLTEIGQTIYICFAFRFSFILTRIDPVFLHQVDRIVLSLKFCLGGFARLERPFGCHRGPMLLQEHVVVIHSYDRRNSNTTLCTPGRMLAH